MAAVLEKCGWLREWPSEMSCESTDTAFEDMNRMPMAMARERQPALRRAG